MMLRTFLATLLGCLAAACAPHDARPKQPPAVWKPLSPADNTAHATDRFVRVVVTFRTVQTDVAQEALQTLAAGSKAREVRYVAPVWGRAHVFQFTLAAGQSAAALMESLQHIAMVQSAEIDTIATVH
ncbi:MAG: hypothetical protein QE265_09125 [Rhodoferax sp.]|nr:hypothetical protein [Rhodoferax sp.]